MLCTKNLLTDIRDISPSWVFSHYCSVDLNEFNGAEFKIHSVFNSERTPSMSFKVKDGVYRFTDYSSGFYGDHIDLVMLLYSLSYSEACNKILIDYNRWTAETGCVYDLKEIKAKETFRVTEWEIRGWDKSDAAFWTSFNIGSSLLNRYNVRPLYSYTMKKETEEFRVLRDNVYGYFKRDGTLIKIYQPFIEEKKFIKVKEYIQGSEQVKGRPFMGYLSSLKDVMAFESLGLNADVKAPDSENTLIPDKVIKQDMEDYKGLFILFDIDINGAGQRAAYKYLDKYNIPPVFLVMGEKDLSDSIKRFGPIKVRERLIPLIDKVINESPVKGSYIGKESLFNF